MYEHTQGTGSNTSNGVTGCLGLGSGLSHMLFPVSGRSDISQRTSWGSMAGASTSAGRPGRYNGYRVEGVGRIYSTQQTDGTAFARRWRQPVADINLHGRRHGRPHRPAGFFSPPGYYRRRAGCLSMLLVLAPLLVFCLLFWFC